MHSEDLPVFSRTQRGEPKGKGVIKPEGRLTAASSVQQRAACREFRVLSFPAPPLSLTCRKGDAYDYLRVSSVCVKVVVTEKGVKL